jgi:hypothetical protein
MGGFRDVGTAGVAGPAPGLGVGAGFPSAAKSVGSGSFNAAASARTAADTAGLVRGTGDGTDLPTGGWGLAPGTPGTAVPGWPERVPGEGVRAGGVGTLGPAGPPPWGDFGGGPEDIREKTRIHELALRNAESHRMPSRCAMMTRQWAFPSCARGSSCT